MVEIRMENIESLGIRRQKQFRMLDLPSNMFMLLVAVQPVIEDMKQRGISA
jgi:hypothetical protein